jgi:hypothetical protein
MGGTNLDEQRKKPYRMLLYRATLDIRSLRWLGSRWRDRINPLFWWSYFRQIREFGAIADWLHNLAFFSALDFERFDEQRFWQDYDWFRVKYPSAGLQRYRDWFERWEDSNGSSTVRQAAP